MPKNPKSRGDNNRGADGADFSQLARELDIDPGVLDSAVEGAAGVLRASRENVRPANKKALDGVAPALGKVIDRLSDDAIRERLVAATFREPDGPDEDGLAYYTAWCAARAQVDHAMASARDLLELVRAGEAFKGTAGRPDYDDWTAAIGSLRQVWTENLGREVTISGHADDGRRVAPSPTLRFVYGCMKYLDPEITEQACRTILHRLQGREKSQPQGDFGKFLG